MLALVTACGTAPMMSGSGQMTPPDGKAYAIVALTFDSWDKDTANVSFVLQGPDGTHEYFAQAMTDFIRDAGDIPDAIGKLHLLTLTPGHYVLPSVWARWHDGSDTIIFSNHVVNIPLNQQFDVRAGQVVYLGDIHAKLNYQPSVAIVDSTARDMNHIKVIWKVPDTSNIQRLPLQPLQVPATAAH
ncbi:hypothetical protein [Amantichitinum ursilacus]|uniref:Uncharacterized protein n=1 Tax=Amantichitinum ursilacus TaxID=857265 RepID=A0A0N0GNH2_9NEIS|nr:hypothetical protein [Amantichitinum ursilacus]KPC52573.1 hypothetical protein WG78_12035 [Amantichitinum ursilacus]